MSSGHKSKSGSSTGGTTGGKAIGGSSSGGGGGGRDKKPSKDSGIPKPPSSRGDSGPSKEEEKGRKIKKAPTAGSSGGKDDRGTAGGGGGSKNSGSASKISGSKSTGLHPAGLSQPGPSSGLVPPSKKGKEPTDRPKPRKLEIRSGPSAGAWESGASGSRGESRAGSPDIQSSGSLKLDNDIKRIGAKREQPRISVKYNSPVPLRWDKLSKAEQDFWKRQRLGERYLPIEIEHQIYSYMLDNRVVRQNIPVGQTLVSHSSDYVKHFGRAHTYNFDFALYGPNHATRKAAIAYFQRCNKLILVEYDMPRFKQFIHYHDIPIITDSAALRRCDEHLLYFKIKLAVLPIDMYTDQVTPAPEKRRAKPEQGFILMLEKDFEKLCNMLKFVFSYVLPPAAIIVNDRHQVFKLRTNYRDNSPTLVLKIIKSEALGSDSRDNLERCLKMLIGGGYGLTITSDEENDKIATPQFLADLQQRISPKLIWCQAFVVHQVFTARKVRDAAAARALQGDHVGARQRYAQLLEFQVLSRRALRDELFDEDQNAVERYSLPGMRGVHLDLCIWLELAALVMTSGAPQTRVKYIQTEEPDDWINYIAVFSNNAAIENSMKLTGTHLSLLFRMLSFLDDTMSELREDDDIQEFVELIGQARNPTEQLTEDMAILSPYLVEDNEVWSQSIVEWSKYANY